MEHIIDEYIECDNENNLEVCPRFKEWFLKKYYSHKPLFTEYVGYCEECEYGYTIIDDGNYQKRLQGVSQDFFDYLRLFDL